MLRAPFPSPPPRRSGELRAAHWRRHGAAAAPLPGGGAVAVAADGAARVAVPAHGRFAVVTFAAPLPGARCNPSPPTAAAAAGRVRLTRRARRLVMLAVVLLLVGLLAHV
jgi:hypothetical protein